MDWLRRIWQGWSTEQSFIHLPGLMCLSDELITSVNRYTYDVQSYIIVIVVNIATKPLKYTPK